MVKHIFEDKFSKFHQISWSNKKLSKFGRIKIDYQNLLKFYSQRDI